MQKIDCKYVHKYMLKSVLFINPIIKESDTSSFMP